MPHEFKTVLSRDPDETLAEVAREGWKLVFVHGPPSYDPRNCRFDNIGSRLYFTRDVPDAPPPFKAKRSPSNAKSVGV